MTDTCLTTRIVARGPYRRGCKCSETALNLCQILLIRHLSDSQTRPRDSRPRSPRRRSRTPDYSRRPARRYRSPYSQRRALGVDGEDSRAGEDEVMGDFDQQEWLLRKAYESGKADERRRIGRIMMDTLRTQTEIETDVETRADGDDLIAL